jgi:hypothetical protein
MASRNGRLGNQRDGFPHRQIGNVCRFGPELVRMSGEPHVMARGALGQRRTDFAQPGQPLPMRELRLGLEQQSSGSDRMLEASLHRKQRGLMFGPDAGGEVGERVGCGEILWGGGGMVLSGERSRRMGHGSVLCCCTAKRRQKSIARHRRGAVPGFSFRGGARARFGHSDKQKFCLAIKGAKVHDLSENDRKLLEYRAPSKLMTRVRFPSPAPAQA